MSRVVRQRKPRKVGDGRAVQVKSTKLWACVQNRQQVCRTEFVVSYFELQRVELTPHALQKLHEALDIVRRHLLDSKLQCLGVAARRLADAWWFTGTKLLPWSTRLKHRVHVVDAIDGDRIIAQVHMRHGSGGARIQQRYATPLATSHES